jgi:signal transduction histidine kinase
MSAVGDQETEGAPPLPLLKRLAQRTYSPSERWGINLLLVLLIGGCVGFLMTRDASRLTGNQFALANWLAITLSSGLFLLRRWLPWPALIGVICLAQASIILRLPGVAIFYMVFCLYGVVAISSQRTGLLLGGLSLALVIGGAILGGGTPQNPASNQAVGGAAIVLVGWLAGENMRSGRIYSRYRLEREAAEAAAAEAERAERTRRTIADERVTIARELHDIVAHSMSVVAVRSGVARMVLDSRPEEASEALAIIETTARQSLAEMRMMVSILRQSSSGEVNPDMGPLPGLGDLDRLITQLAAAGVDVELEVDGPARPLAPAADLTAYRIVQEALTNVVRHAAPTTATVRLAFASDQLDINVANAASGHDGTAAGSVRPLRGTEPGHGLVGMRERAAMFGGTLEAGPADDGFRVHTKLRIDG